MEAVDGPSNTAKHSLVFDSPQIPLGGRFEVDAVGGPGHDIRTLQAEFSLDLRPAATAWLFQCPACSREVDPVLERLQQFKVIGADKGRDGFSVPFKHDTFALVGDTVDGFRKRVTNGGGRKSGHLRRGSFRSVHSVRSEHFVLNAWDRHPCWRTVRATNDVTEAGVPQEGTRVGPQARHEYLAQMRGRDGHGPGDDRRRDARGDRAEAAPRAMTPRWCGRSGRSGKRRANAAPDVAAVGPPAPRGVAGHRSPGARHQPAPDAVYWRPTSARFVTTGGSC